MFFSTVFGFHNAFSAPQLPNYKVFNVSHLLGYIPILGIFTGTMEILSARTDWHASNDRQFEAGLITRGAIEILGGGLLLLIPDILVTIGRHCYVREQGFERV